MYHTADALKYIESELFDQVRVSTKINFNRFGTLKFILNNKPIDMFRSNENAVVMLETKVLKLLKGDALDENEELCDFTLADQNEACGNSRQFCLLLFLILIFCHFQSYLFCQLLRNYVEIYSSI